MREIGISLLIASFLFGGCASKGTICPKPNAPTKDVLMKIQSLKDYNVDRWLVKQYKLHQQLKACNE